MEWKDPEQAIVQNLIDAGCDEETIACYCELAKRSQKEPLVQAEQICLLNGYRKKLIGQLRDCQAKLDCLDYLLFGLREKKGK